MEEIFQGLGISKTTINNMMEIDSNLKELSDKEIYEKIEILKKLKCDNIQIRNIISSNVMYLERDNKDIEKLIKKLQEKGFSMLNILFDGNPYILNIDDYEIEKYIASREQAGEKLEDIVDDMEANRYIFQDI